MRSPIVPFIDLVNRLLPGPPPSTPETISEESSAAAFEELKIELTGEPEYMRDTRESAPAERRAVASAIRNTLFAIVCEVDQGRGKGALVPIMLDKSQLGQDGLLINPNFPPLASGVDRRKVGLRGPFEIQVQQPTTAAWAYQQFLIALDGLDASWIRKCEVCQRIFWKSRVDAEVCSKNCRVKRWQKKNLARWDEIQAKHENQRKEKRTLRRLAKQPKCVPGPNSFECCCAVCNVTPDILHNPPDLREYYCPQHCPICTPTTES